jgi:hypothetical protein
VTELPLRPNDHRCVRCYAQSFSRAQRLHCYSDSLRNNIISRVKIFLRLQASESFYFFVAELILLSLVSRSDLKSEIYCGQMCGSGHRKPVFDSHTEWLASEILEKSSPNYRRGRANYIVREKQKTATGQERNKDSRVTLSQLKSRWQVNRGNMSRKSNFAQTNCVSMLYSTIPLEENWRAISHSRVICIHQVLPTCGIVNHTERVCCIQFWAQH